MTLNDRPNDEILTTVASLRTYDVSPRHADRLRSRCHALLHARPRQNTPVGMAKGTAFRRVVGPALGGAWCLAYLVEIIRRAAAAHGL